MTWRPPNTLPPVDEWRTHDGIQCLDCGEWFKSLGQHLIKTHGTTVHEYRYRWGMRQRQPLSCGSVSEDRRRIAEATGGPERMRSMAADQLPIAHAAARNREHRPQELRTTTERMVKNRLEKDAARRSEIRNRIAKKNRCGFDTWAKHEYEDRGRTVRELAAEAGVSQTLMNKLLREAGVTLRRTGPRT